MVVGEEADERHTANLCFDLAEEAEIKVWSEINLLYLDFSSA
jgi:hypothetical protein